MFNFVPKAKYKWKDEKCFQPKQRITFLVTVTRKKD
jgi:hypothetical protein